MGKKKEEELSKHDRPLSRGEKRRREEERSSAAALNLKAVRTTLCEAQEREREEGEK